jgi:hypothetical protein
MWETLGSAAWSWRKLSCHSRRREENQSSENEELVTNLRSAAVPSRRKVREFGHT